MLDAVLSLVGLSKTQKHLRDVLLGLEITPGYQSMFDRRNSGDLATVLTLLRRTPGIEEVLPAPGARALEGQHACVKQGHTLELYLPLDGEGRPLGSQGGVPHKLCLTRLGPDVWGWYLEQDTARLPSYAQPAALLRPGDLPPS